MMYPQLPERPNLDQLKRQAKDLLRSARARDAEALARLRALPAFAHRTDDEIVDSAALHDAQSVVARELGFPSFKALAEHVEELSLGFDAAVEQFVMAATEVQPDRAERLLKLHPRIGRANFHAALLLGEAALVEARLDERPALAREAGGPREWEPLLYLCHTSLKFGPSEREAGMTACARLLLARGADSNARYPWLHHGVRRPALWGAVCDTGSLSLTKVLLEGGADPDDGVTFPLAAGGGNIAALELLHEHHAEPNQPWASDGSTTLYSIMQWADTSTGVYWLLDHGADPDPVFAPNGETPLHTAARRWDAGVVEALVGHGADIERRRSDGRTPYAVARLSGNDAVAEWLAQHGAATELSDVDRLVAACSRGDRAAADALLRAHPWLAREIGPEHYEGLYRAAERNDAAALETMLACGFDPNHGDEIGKTALHAAAMEGWPDAVRVLLAHGASVSLRDNEFHGQPLVWAAEGSRAHRGDHRDHRRVGQMLLEAGSPTDWEGVEEPSAELLDIIREWSRPH